MHVGARSARLDEPVAGIGIPAGSGTLRRIYDHRIGKPDQLCVARRTGPMRTLPEPLVRRPDRRGQHGDRERRKERQSRRQSAGMGLGMERFLRRRDHRPFAQKLLADVGQRMGAADRTRRDPVGRGRIRAVSRRPGTAGARTLAIRQAGRSENRRQNTGERLVGNGRRTGCSRIGTRGAARREPDVGGYGRRDAELESGRLSVDQPGTVPVLPSGTAAGNLLASTGRKTLRQTGRTAGMPGMAPLFRSVQGISL